MVPETRISELIDKHRRLDKKIEEEMTRPMADTLKISELKRQKLRLKDEMHKLQCVGH